MAQFIKTLAASSMYWALGCLVAISAGCQKSDVNPSMTDQNSASNEVGSNAPDQMESPLAVLVIDDPQFQEALDRHWQAHTGNKLQLQQMSLDAARTWLTSDSSEHSEDNGNATWDVIVFPSPLIGELIQQRRIAALPRFVVSDASWKLEDIFTSVREQEIVWGERTYAVPLGSPVLTLAFRPADQQNQPGRSTFKTWDELAMWVKERSVASQATLPRILAQPLAEGFAAHVLLARAAAYARHPGYFSTLFDYQTMQPTIDGPPFVRALKQLIADAGSDASWQLQATPQHCLTELLTGSCMLAMAWPYRDFTDDVSQHADIEYLELPGSAEVFHRHSATWETRELPEPWRSTYWGFQGRLAAVTRDCKRKRIAANFLARVSGPEWSIDIASHGMRAAPFRTTHLQRPSVWTGRNLASDQRASQYVATVQRVLDRRNGMLALRIPGQTDYMQALDRAVRRAVQRQADPEQALGEAARDWNAITQRAGWQQQTAAYRQSLGLE